MDLSDALKLSPHNREIHRFAVRVREELRISQSGNNNEGEVKGPVGAGQQFSFVDEALADDDVSPK